MTVPGGDDRPTLDTKRESEVRAIFANQGFMATIGARLEQVAAGRVVASLVPTPAVSQQHGFVHAAAVAGLLDTCCGAAAYSLMVERAGVLTVEYKVNLLSPARGDRIVATGEVVKAGRTVTVCRGEAVAYSGDQVRTVALMQASMMTVLGRDDVKG